ncbi:ribonuclease H [Trifolium pratense]|uniref:Ribonuclease H n=1 Tax=Trifolium pratense TaxID=57577 RepID=A0A2K3NW60_TRIPR|nr:ribonuclease H [Trifolium pratense]
MHPFKAPGPDGFQGIFFKQYWHIIGDDVVRLISTAFETGGFPPSLSETLIALIPKADCPNNFKKSFGPLVFLPDGRGTTDNAIILQEAIHTMRKSNRKKGDIVFKIDLEKAYDNVRNIDDGLWKSVRLSRNGPPLSHLFFADDVLLFAKATKSQALNIASRLKSFADYSGLQVNVSKSKVFFSSNIRRGKISSIVTSTGINRTLSLEKYLGFPMMHGRLQRRDFEFLEEKISKSLASWQHNLLNKAGRMTSVKSVLNSIPKYYMQIAWLPQSTCDFIDRMARNFLWKGSSDTGMHLVGWDKITKPKKLGGLGIRKARDANTSLLDGFHYRMGNGNSSFWFTDWSGNAMLVNQVLFVVIHDLEMRVRDVHIAARDGYYWLNRHSFSVNTSNVISWSLLWHLPAPEKLKFFLWTTIHNSLPTREMLTHRGILHGNLCPRCNTHLETTLHCLRDCDFAQSIWKSTGFSSKATTLMFGFAMTFVAPQCFFLWQPSGGFGGQGMLCA